MTLTEGIESYKVLSKAMHEQGKEKLSLDLWQTASWLEELKEFRQTDPNFPKLNLKTLKMEG